MVGWLSLWVGNLKSATSPTCRGGSVSRETWKFIQLLGKRVIQLFVVAGAYGFALFENRETQTRWLAFADLAFVRVFLSYSSEIRLNHPVVFQVKHHYTQTHDHSQGLINYVALPRWFHVEHGLLFYEASKWIACST